MRHVRRKMCKEAFHLRVVRGGSSIQEEVSGNSIHKSTVSQHLEENPDTDLYFYFVLRLVQGEDIEVRSPNESLNLNVISFFNPEFVENGKLNLFLFSGALIVSTPNTTRSPDAMTTKSNRTSESSRTPCPK